MADGMNFTQYQPPQMGNPLQAAGQAQEMAARAQAMQQQQQEMQAKLAIGKHMQGAIDPATGQFDKYKFITNLAADPEGQYGFGQAYKMMLENGEIEQRTLGQQLQNQQNKYNLVSNMLAPLQRAIADGDTVRDKLPGFVAQGISNGVFKNHEEGMQYLVNLTGAVGKSEQAAKDLVIRMGQANDNTRASLETNMGLVRQGFAPREMFDEEGRKLQTPLRNVPGAMPGAFAASMQAGKFTNTAEEGSVAPGPQSAVGQEAQPSESPAPLPSGSTYMEPTYEAENLRAFKSPKEEHWLKQDIKEKDAAAKQANEFVTKLDHLESSFRQFQQGPGMEGRASVASALRGLGAPESVVRDLIGARTKGDALAAVQAAQKQVFDLVTSRLRESMPGSRYTDFDLSSMQKNTPNIGMDKDAINVLMNNMRNIALISKEEAAITRKYGDWSVKNFKNKDRAFNRSVLDDTVQNILTHKGLYRDTGPIDVNRMPGEQ